MCSNSLASIRKELKKQNPQPPPGNCPICNNYTENWILDHCHFNNSFRGYICNNCNLGLGKFNDDIEIVQKALLYLQSGSQNISPPGFLTRFNKELNIYLDI